jgi:hypothetical protein
VNLYQKFALPRSGLGRVSFALGASVILGAAIGIVCAADLSISSITVSSNTVVIGITNTVSLGHISIERSFGLESQCSPPVGQWAIMSNAWQEIAESSNAESCIVSTVQKSEQPRAFYRINGLATPYRANGAFHLITPYVNESDVERVWGYNFDHDGTDFKTRTNNAPFRAVCDGEIISRVLVHEFNPNLNTNVWHVIVVLKYSHLFSIMYDFEPATDVDTEGVAQLTNVVVSVGQTVSQGETIGRLHVPPDEMQSHVTAPVVHFGLMVTDEDSLPYGYTDTTGQTHIVCVYPGVWPEQYFAAEAWNSFTNLYGLSGEPLWH